MSDKHGRWSWVFDFITMAAVLVGLTFGAIELRQIREAQESQTVLQLFETLHAPGFARGISLIFELPDTISPTGLREVMGTEEGEFMQRVRLAFEGIGVMVYREDISIEWVDEMLRYSILVSWDRFEQLTLEDRELSGLPDLMEWHQWLAERLMEGRTGSQTPAYEAYADWTPGS